MSDNKKYYYLKFKETYFDQDHVKVIEAMKNGYEYSLIILKLYLKSLKFEGQLKINESIPYMKDKIDLLAGVIGHDPANVMHAINIAKELGIIEIIDTGEIFMLDIHNFIGHNSTEAERKRIYREKINKKQIENKEWDKNGTMSQNCSREIEIEIEKEINNIFLYWNSKNIVVHRDSYIKKFKKRHKDLIKEIGIDPIKKAIDNYSLIINSDNYWYSYKFELVRFLEKIETFLDTADPLHNYLKKEQKEIEIETPPDYGMCPLCNRKLLRSKDKCYNQGCGWSLEEEREYNESIRQGK